MGKDTECAGCFESSDKKWLMTHESLAVCEIYRGKRGPKYCSLDIIFVFTYGGDQLKQNFISDANDKSRHFVFHFSLKLSYSIYVVKKKNQFLRFEE